MSSNSANGDAASEMKIQEEDDDIPHLSEHAMAALQEFYSERLAAEEHVIQPDEGGAGSSSVAEDWQLSQFWYDDKTSTTLAREALAASQNSRIACLCCPTLYAKLLEVKPQHCVAVLLEFDRRFEQRYGAGFVFYDYRAPLSLPESVEQGSFDLVVADPPFLSEECLEKTAETIKFLTKGKVLLCTGTVMEETASRILGVRRCCFVPRHIRNLANVFCCYTNYQSHFLD